MGLIACPPLSSWSSCSLIYAFFKSNYIVIISNKYVNKQKSFNISRNILRELEYSVERIIFRLSALPPFHSELSPNVICHMHYLVNGWLGSSIITSSTYISLIVVNTIQNCIVGMEPQKYNFNSFYRYIIANSLFTTRQIDIISRRLENRGTIENISSGAYYRQVKQSRTKIVRLLYSIILLKCVGALNHETFFAIEKMASQIEVMFDQKTSDNSRAESVISVIEQLVKRMCKV